MKKTKKLKICLISSSGGHFEQLRMLKYLSKKYNLIWITEKTKYKEKVDYYMMQTGNKDIFFPFKMFINTIKSIYIWIKVRPKVVITTGAMVSIPISLMAKLFRKKLIYIETFARVKDGTRTGKFLYRYADLFIVQWKPLLNVYPKAIYGGSIY